MKQNILEILAKAKNDCDIVLEDGTITSEKKFVDTLKKEYLAKVKNDEIDMMKISFGQYVADKQATDLQALEELVVLYLMDDYEGIIEKLKSEFEEDKQDGKENNEMSE